MDGSSCRHGISFKSGHALICAIMMREAHRRVDNLDFEFSRTFEHAGGNPGDGHWNCGDCPLDSGRRQSSPDAVRVRLPISPPDSAVLATKAAIHDRLRQARCMQLRSGLTALNHSSNIHFPKLIHGHAHCEILLVFYFARVRSGGVRCAE